MMDGETKTDLVFPVNGSYGKGTGRLSCSNRDGLNTVLHELEVQCKDGRSFQVGTTPSPQRGRFGGSNMFGSGDEEIMEAEIIEETEETEITN